MHYKVRTGASKRLTEDTSGLSGTFLKCKRAFSLKLESYKRYRVRHFVHVVM